MSYKIVKMFLRDTNLTRAGSKIKEAGKEKVKSLDNDERAKLNLGRQAQGTYRELWGTFKFSSALCNYLQMSHL